MYAIGHSEVQLVASAPFRFCAGDVEVGFREHIPKVGDLDGWLDEQMELEELAVEEEARGQHGAAAESSTSEDESPGDADADIDASAVLGMEGPEQAPEGSGAAVGAAESASAVVAVVAQAAEARAIAAPRANHAFGQVDAHGRIVINLHPSAQSLDAHCDRCGARVNRKFLANPSRREAPQGRPMGSLLAWLRQDCTGSPAEHKALLDAFVLDYRTRLAAREWGQGLGTLADCFAKERQPWPSEGEEPYRMP